MIIWYLISIGLALAYAMLIYKIYSAWTFHETWSIPDNFKARTYISVIVACRNESKNILKLLDALIGAASKYEGKFEIIIVNDHSEDNTASLVSDYKHPSVKLVNLDSQSGKKAAISTGVSMSMGELILTTDADCIVPQDWFNIFASYFEFRKVDFIAGPVIFSQGDGLIEKLQVQDLSGMMGVTQAGITTQKWYMANGANMAFRRSRYNELQAYKDNQKWASGDDMFLIQSMALKNANSIGYIKTKEAVVTKPEPTLERFVRQRLRWGTKNKAYRHNGIIKTLGLVFGFSSVILINIVLSPIVSTFLFFVALFQILIKWSIDYLFLKRMTEYFDQDEAMKKYILIAPIYLIYIVGIGLASLFVKNYRWKGRRVS